jgi:hypothetical protein
MRRIRLEPPKAEARASEPAAAPAVE